MGSVAEQMIRDLNRAVDRPVPGALGAFTAHFDNGIWQVTLYYGLRRIMNAARPSCLTFHSITVAKPLRGYGFMTEMLDMILEDPSLFRQPLDWIYFEQCQYRLANHLVDRHGFTSEIGLVTDAYRSVTPQMALAI